MRVHCTQLVCTLTQGWKRRYKRRPIDSVSRRPHLVTSLSKKSCAALEPQLKMKRRVQRAEQREKESIKVPFSFKLTCVSKHLVCASILQTGVERIVHRMLAVAMLMQCRRHAANAINRLPLRLILIAFAAAAALYSPI